MTDAEKRALVAAELVADASRSDRAIARVVGCSPTFVGSVRKAACAPSTASTDASMNMDGLSTVSTLSTDTLAAEVARLTAQVAELADRLAALEAKVSAASQDASAASAPPMDGKEISRGAYKKISKLLPLLKAAQRSQLRDRLRAWR